jgi:hypothetical protein
VSRVAGPPRTKAGGHGRSVGPIGSEVGRPKRIRHDRLVALPERHRDERERPEGEGGGAGGQEAATLRGRGVGAGGSSATGR